MRLRTTPVDLTLRHTFRIARGADDTRHNVLAEIEHEGLLGRGEAAPIPRYGQSRESSRVALDTIGERLEAGHLDRFDDAGEELVPFEQASARAALDMALRDLAAQRFGVPLCEALGLDRRRTPLTSFTIAIDTPEAMARRAVEASDYEILKVKLGSEDDRARLEAIRDVTDRPLRVDANEGWTLAEAEANLAWLATLGVELVEQPLPAHRLEDTRALRRLSPLPLIADENVHRAADIPRLADAFDGINLKLMKCGGIGEALRIIHTARAHGMSIMIGCMIESSVGITAAAHLTPLVDFADLDGNLLVTDDPFVGSRVEGGRIVLPDAPGLGVSARR